MPIAVSCPQCGRKLNAPDDLAGRRVKCPQCSAAVQIPATGSGAAAPQAAQGRPQPAGKAPAGKAEWYAEASDGTQHGPLTAGQLRELVGSGRLDEFSRVRKQGTDQWQWLEAAFPNLAASAGETTGRKAGGGSTPADAAMAAGERLHPCPDCGTVISRRAQQCPHCGCPVATGGESPAARAARTAGAEQGPADERAQGKKGFLMAGGMVLALIVIGVPVLVGIQYLLAPEPPPAPPPVVAEPAVASPPAPTVTAGQKRQWIEEVAAATARELDGLYARVHSVNAMMARAQESVGLIEALAQGKFPDAPAEPAAPKAAEAPAYESQYESLCQECRAHLEAKLPQGDFELAKVQETAEAWAAAKREPLEKQLHEINQQILAP